jgi:hypothetical protein
MNLSHKIGLLQFTKGYAHLTCSKAPTGMIIYIHEIARQYELTNDKKIEGIEINIKLFLSSISPILRLVFISYIKAVEVLMSITKPSVVYRFISEVPGINSLHEVIASVVLMLYHDDH